MIDVLLKWRARFRAIADLPVPQTPLMKISLLPSLIESRISLTTSAWVLLFENFNGGSSSPSVLKGPENSLLVISCSLLEFVLLYNDHIFCLVVRGRGLCF